MDGLECSEVMLKNIDLGDRYDSEYFTKEYLAIDNNLKHLKTEKLGNLSSVVASAFYPAATDLYKFGDTPFIRCVDCISHPIITNSQDDKFEKIPLKFGIDNNGISFLNKGDIVITKVGTPCYASIIEDYNIVALSRTVLGLTHIQNIDPYYLMIFFRSRYGFEQLYRERELTIQYQLTLSRIKNINVYTPSQEFQRKIRECCARYISNLKFSKKEYIDAQNQLLSYINFHGYKPNNIQVAIKNFTSSYSKSCRLDAEYYQPKYDELFNQLENLKTYKLGDIVNIKKSIEPGSTEYRDVGIPFVRVSDLSEFGISETHIHLDRIPYSYMGLQPKKNTILFSKDGSVGICI